MGFARALTGICGAVLLLGCLVSCRTAALLHRPLGHVSHDMAYVMWVLSWEEAGEVEVRGEK